MADKNREEKEARITNAAKEIGGYSRLVVNHNPRVGYIVVTFGIIDNELGLGIDCNCSKEDLVELLKKVLASVEAQG